MGKNNKDDPAWMKSRIKCLEELESNPEDKRHGVTGYTYGCRCDECKKANTLKGRKYRGVGLTKKDSVSGPRRYLRAGSSGNGW